MTYIFKIKESKINNRQIEGLLVNGDPDGMIKEAVVSGDFVIVETYSEIDCDDYAFWNDENGEEVLWIEGVKK